MVCPMRKPLVSVLITAYNREKYIREAIESVLTSTFKNFELIVVDDCSKDGTVEIAKEFGRIDNRVRVYVNEKNLGDYPNRNKAAEYAMGKYIKYVDSDDMVYPQTLEIMVKAMENNPQAALAISSRNDNLEFNQYNVLTPKEAYQTHFYKRALLDCGPTGVLIKTDSFRSAGGFSGKRNVSDFELWLFLAALNPVIEMPNKLVFWRIHPEQEIHLASEIYLEQSLLVYEKALTSQNCPLTLQQREEILYLRKRSTFRGILKYGIKTRKFLYMLKLIQINRLRLTDVF